MQRTDHTFRMTNDDRLTFYGTTAELTPGIASALQQRPAEALRQIEGAFALAFRDTSGRTLIAVDRFAVQSLCYRIVGSELRVATRADALADEATEIDPQAIFDYLFF